MSELYQSLSHSKWDCKYHVVCAQATAQRIGRFDGEIGVLQEQFTQRAEPSRQLPNNRRDCW